MCGMALAGLPEEPVAQARALHRAKQQAPQGAAAGGVSGALLRALSAAARILARAGHELQQALAAVYADPAVEGFGVSGDPPTAAVGRELLEAYSVLGDVLASLASITYTDVVEPLQDIQRSLQKDTERARLDLVHIERYESQCSRDVRESIVRKDEASWKLTNAVHESEKLRKALPGFLSRLVATKLDSQVHQAANLQTVAVEDLAINLDRAALTRHQREKARLAFQDSLSAVDERCTFGLRTSNVHCAAAWRRAGRDLQNIAERLESDAACGKRSRSVGGNFIDDLSARAETPTRQGDMRFDSAPSDLGFQEGEDEDDAGASGAPANGAIAPPGPSAAGVRSARGEARSSTPADSNCA